MTAKHSILAARAASALALAAPAQSRIAADGATVTIFAYPAILNSSIDQLTLSGSIAGGTPDEIVTIQIKECSATWFRGVAAVRTRAGGGWSNELVIPTTRPATNASIRAAVRAALPLAEVEPCYLAGTSRIVRT